MTNEKLSPVYQAAGQGDLAAVELDSAEVEDVARDKRRHTTVSICQTGESLNCVYLKRCDRKCY